MTRHRVPTGLALLLMLGFWSSGCMHDQPLAPEAAQHASARTSALLNARANENACWGQATQVFARMGEMGAHASQQSTPRLGLRNLARALHEQGVLPDDSLQALGAFVADALGLSIAACR